MLLPWPKTSSLIPSLVSLKRAIHYFGMVITAHPVCYSRHLVLAWCSYQSVVTRISRVLTMSAQQIRITQGEVHFLSTAFLVAPQAYPLRHNQWLALFPQALQPNGRYCLTWATDIPHMTLVHISDLCVFNGWDRYLNASYSVLQKSLRSYGRETIVKTIRDVNINPNESSGNHEKVGHSDRCRVFTALTIRNSDISNPSMPGTQQLTPDRRTWIQWARRRPALTFSTRFCP